MAENVDKIEDDIEDEEGTGDDLAADNLNVSTTRLGRKRFVTVGQMNQTESTGTPHSRIRNIRDCTCEVKSACVQVSFFISVPGIIRDGTTQ